MLSRWFWLRRRWLLLLLRLLPRRWERRRGQIGVRLFVRILIVRSGRRSTRRVILSRHVNLWMSVWIVMHSVGLGSAYSNTQSHIILLHRLLLQHSATDSTRCWLWGTVSRRHGDLKMLRRGIDMLQRRV